jgi:hypothetical protein
LDVAYIQANARGKESETPLHVAGAALSPANCIDWQARPSGLLAASTALLNNELEVNGMEP